MRNPIKFLLTHDLATFNLNFCYAQTGMAFVR